MTTAKHDLTKFLELLCLILLKDNDLSLLEQNKLLFYFYFEPGRTGRFTSVSSQNTLDNLPVVGEGALLIFSMGLCRL